MKVLALLATTFSQLHSAELGLLSFGINVRSVNQKSQYLMQFLHHCKVMSGLSPEELPLFGFVDSQFFPVWCLGTVDCSISFSPPSLPINCLFLYLASSLFFFSIAQYHTLNQNGLDILFQDNFLNTFLV